MINKLGQGVAGSIKLDWNNPRVICIAESYSKLDVDTVEVVPLRIELFKHRYYEQGIFGLESLTVPEAASAATPASSSLITDKPTSTLGTRRSRRPRSGRCCRRTLPPGAAKPRHRHGAVSSRHRPSLGAADPEGWFGAVRQSHLVTH